VRSLLCVVVVVGLFSGSNQTAKAAEPAQAQHLAKGYAVHPVRPVSVGQKHHLNLSYARNFQLQITGVPWPREIQVNQTVDLSASAEVLAVNEHGNPTKVRLVVEKGSFLKGDRLKVNDELTPGEVLNFEFRKDDGFVVTREQGEFKQRVARLFAEALPYARWALSDRRNQKFFDDSHPPRKTGETWTADGGFLTALTPRFINLDKTRLTGTLSLDGLVRLAGQPCMRLVAKMQLPKYTAEDGSLSMVAPREVEFTDGTFDGHVTCWVPLDPSRQPVKWTETWRATITGRPKAKIGGKVGHAVAAVHITRTIQVADLGAD
jgi:hypothetical protein